MNIFVLDTDVSKAAEYHCNSHIVKMPLETAQLLCTALHSHGQEVPYKPTHRKHPCTIWTSENRQNFLWLSRLGKELCKEYSYRYNKVHKCEAIIDICISKADALPDSPITPFAQAMPDEFKNECAITAYRNYYRGAKQHLAIWSNRSIPHWYFDEIIFSETRISNTDK